MSSVSHVPDLKESAKNNANISTENCLTNQTLMSTNLPWPKIQKNIYKCLNRENIWPCI
jgi:lambda repressor-like predicted transcriptional regulator